MCIRDRYESVPQQLRDSMTFLTSLSVPVAWRRQYCGVFEAKDVYKRQAIHQADQSLQPFQL